MWHECYQRGIAAMSEYNHRGEGVPDLTDVEASAFSDLWNACLFTNITGKIALMNLRYKMAPGDVIYAKDEQEIVGCGVVLSQYEYDPDILAGSDVEWEHFVRVSWDHDFKPIHVLLGAERQTILRLKEGHVSELESRLKAGGQVLKRPADNNPTNVPHAAQGTAGPSLI